MKSSSTTLGSFALNVILATASIVHGFEVFGPPAKPLPPSQDPFYIDKPVHLESYAPGDLIRVRRAPGNLTAMFNASAAYNLVYRTEDSYGQPLWSFTTLFSPLEAYNSEEGHKHQGKGTALLSYQIPYNTANVDWSISASMYDPSQLPLLGDATAALARGWFVAVPDYEGPFASSVAGRLEGQAILDGVRAIYALAGNKQLPRGLYPLGLDSDTAQFALWGYSGGAISSGWAGAMQPFYAPDLRPRFAGLVTGGMAPDLLATADVLDGTVGAGLLPNSLLGITQQFPASREFLVSHLKPATRDAFMAALNMSSEQAFAAFANQSIFGYFENGRADLHSPMLSAVLDAHFDVRRKGIPAVPVFAYKAIGDEFSPIALSDGMIAEYCDRGANVLYERNTVGEHLSEFQNGHSRCLAWLDSVFNGTYSEIYQATGCVVKNVTVVDPTGPPLDQL